MARRTCTLVLRRGTSALSGELVGPFDQGRGGPGGWWKMDEPELHLGPEVLVSDVDGWRREWMPALPEGAAFELARDWVCEALSPSTRRGDVTDERDLYGVKGVKHLWFVDPEARTLEVFALDGTAWRLVKVLKENEVRISPCKAIAFPLSAL